MEEINWTFMKFMALLSYGYLGSVVLIVVNMF